MQINHVDPFHVSLLTFVEISDGLNVETGNEEVRNVHGEQWLVGLW